MTQDPFLAYKQPGLAVFAGIIAGILGAMNLIYGVLLLVNSEFVVLIEDELFYFDANALAWLLVIFGVVQILASIGILTARTWARLVGIAWASIVAVGHMFVLPARPFWSLLFIGLAVLIIYALAAGMVESEG